MNIIVNCYGRSRMLWIQLRIRARVASLQSFANHDSFLGVDDEDSELENLEFVSSLILKVEVSLFLFKFWDLRVIFSSGWKWRAVLIEHHLEKVVTKITCLPFLAIFDSLPFHKSSLKFSSSHPLFYWPRIKTSPSYYHSSSSLCSSSLLSTSPHYHASARYQPSFWQPIWNTAARSISPDPVTTTCWSIGANTTALWPALWTTAPQSRTVRTAATSSPNPSPGKAPIQAIRAIRAIGADYPPWSRPTFSAEETKPPFSATTTSSSIGANATWCSRPTSWAKAWESWFRATSYIGGTNSTRCSYATSFAWTATSFAWTDHRWFTRLAFATPSINQLLYMVRRRLLRHFLGHDNLSRSHYSHCLSSLSPSDPKVWDFHCHTKCSVSWHGRSPQCWLYCAGKLHQSKQEGQPVLQSHVHWCLLWEHPYCHHVYWTLHRTQASVHVCQCSHGG